MQKSGLTACQLLRKFILETEIRPRPPDEYAQLLRELSAIGNNINQMAYKANGFGEICVEEVRAMREAFEKLYKEVKR
ncbi:MAG: plasmid mobilization relaxosome protein MobC [Oscillospiraceae bacterium]|nr:plasmid mobilization relaxosome protein MobC [Oscillospiraceae bacterium]